MAVVCQFRLAPDNSSRKNGCLCWGGFCILSSFWAAPRIFLCCPRFQWGGFLFGERRQRQPASRSVAKTHFSLISFRDQVQECLLSSMFKRDFFFSFLKSLKQKEGSLEHSLNNRCLFSLTPHRLFSGWALRKLGYEKDTEERSK